MTLEDVEGFAKSLAVARDYTGFIVRPALEELGGILADTVGFWRLKNQVNCVLKTKKFLEEKGIDPSKGKPLVPNIFVPLLEAAGDSDDPDISEMFARLLESHIDPNGKQVHPAFAKILAQFSPMDAKILEIVNEIGNKIGRKGNRGIVKYNVHPVMNISDLEIDLSLTNLARLGIIDDETISIFNPAISENLRITDFGHQFFKACGGNLK
jgi:Abortive infection alpha